VRRAVDKFIANNKKGTFVLQLTAMVDMFTILIVFLLKSFDTSPVQVSPSQNIILPHSYSVAVPSEVLKVAISKKSIVVGDKEVVILIDGKVNEKDMDLSDPKFIKPLFEALDEQAKKTEAISKENKDHKFDGQIILQADKGLNYGILEKVFYTSSMAGYTDLKLATITYE